MYLNPKDYYDSSRNLETTTTNNYQQLGLLYYEL